MDRETAAAIQHAVALSQWAAQAVVEMDERTVPLDNDEQRAERAMLRELLVRVSQRETLHQWMLESRMPWLLRFLLGARKRLTKKP